MEPAPSVSTEGWKCCLSTWGCWRLNFQPSANGMLQPVLGQDGSHHQSMPFLSFPLVIPPPGKADAAKATATTRNREEELLQGQEKGHVRTSSPNPAFYGCAAKVILPEPSSLRLCCKKSSCLTLPSPLEKSDRQSSPLHSCTAPCRHHPNPSASRQCHPPSGRHLNSEMPKEQHGI